MRKLWLVGVIGVLGLLAACTPTPTATLPPTEAAHTVAPTPEAQLVSSPGRVVFSELLPGIPGDNTFEFVELYNAGTEPVDLTGWSLWYRMMDSKDEEQVYRWEGEAVVPGYGHYLLAHPDTDVGMMPDAVYTTPLFERKGGLVLRDADDQVVDAIGWGEAPSGYFEGTPAEAASDGASLERRPGGEAGNGTDTDDNRQDFAARPTPQPQNSGSPLTPLPEQRLEIRTATLASVQPGATVPYTVTVSNHTGKPQAEMRASIPIPRSFLVEAMSAREGVGQTDHHVLWTVPSLADGESAELVLLLRAPWTYLTEQVGGAYVEAQGWPLRAYAGPLTFVTKGGSIPIATARTLKGKTVTVEGIATMYTGGFYAGSSGTKFYLEDESGGVQVYCPGGKDVVSVTIGSRVIVTGEVDIYRDSVEVIPSTYPDDVRVLAEEAESPAPTPITGAQANGDAAILGRLTSVEGTVTRLEESSYSYEIDLQDEQGDTVFVNIEKQTGIVPDNIEVGKLYRITGISELYSGLWQLKPRTLADFEEIYPPELLLELTTQDSVPAGSPITYTLTASNHTDAPLTHVQITAQPPQGVLNVRPLDGGVLQAGKLTWEVPSLAADGGQVVVRFVVQPGPTREVTVPPATVTAQEWPEAVTTQPWRTFVGDGVPIWAIQGTGDTSPYVRHHVATQGIVTGIFPGFEGFWIESATPDSDPATSEGLFVYAPQMSPDLAAGDLVSVYGKIREQAGQTLLELASADDVRVLRHNQPEPRPVSLDPPQDETEANVYFEALEGMVVQIAQPAVAVAPTSKYGEAALVLKKWGIERVMRGDPTGMLIFVDDGSAVDKHTDASTLPYALKSGDEVDAFVGPLAYTYEHYKIEPLITPTIKPVDKSVPTLEPAGADEFSIATFNVENLFDTKDPNPSDPPKPTRDQYHLKLEKVAQAIAAMGAPTIIGLEEVENIGVLQDIAAHPSLQAYHYQPYLIEGHDPRGIDVGYLVRGDMATVEGVSQHDAPEGLTSRPPLLITVTVQLADGPQTVYALVNHFSSMAGGEKATAPRRTAQAEWNVTLVKQILAAHPQAYIAVMGDLNSYYDSPPLDALRDGGLRHVYEAVSGERPYTYVFQGESETLDHILVTPSLFEHLVRVSPLHIDADYPPPTPGDESPLRVSDHDPLVAVFRFE